MSIPVTDFERVLSCSEGLSSCDAVQELHSAFTTVGFVFIKNHGIDRRMIDRAFEVATQFFTHSVEEKEKYTRVGTDNNGYVCLERESTDPSIPGDLKEAFDICTLHGSKYPDALVPSFKPTVVKLYDQCIELSVRILEAMGYALGLKDPQYFVKAHSKMGLGSDHSYATLRLLYYPPLPPDSDIKSGQLRCGEHVDYGSITLLFQDPSGGLQVKCSDGHYIDVPYMPDAVLVNLGALMQQWTSDLYLATPHKVLIPEDESRKRAVRQSMTFFAHPNHDMLVECIDGSNKYPPITAHEDTLRRLQASYKY